MRNQLLFVAAAALLGAGSLAAQQPRDFSPFLISDRAAEVALARTAAPAAISDSATVMVLIRTGYVEASHGKNGFTCLVLRSFASPVGDPKFWNPKIRAPHCLTPPAVRTVLPEMLKRAEWVLAGVSPAEIAARTKAAYASHTFPMPAVGAMAYMTSSQQYLQDPAPQNWVPHVMFYYDRSLPASTWGAIGDATTVLDGSDPASPVQTLLVPVRRWSDGTLATAAPAAGH